MCGSVEGSGYCVQCFCNICSGSASVHLLVNWIVCCHVDCGTSVIYSNDMLTKCYGFVVEFMKLYKTNKVMVLLMYQPVM